LDLIYSQSQMFYDITLFSLQSDTDARNLVLGDHANGEIGSMENVSVNQVASQMGKILIPVNQPIISQYTQPYLFLIQASDVYIIQYTNLKYNQQYIGKKRNDNSNYNSRQETTKNKMNSDVWGGVRRRRSSSLVKYGMEIILPINSPRCSIFIDGWLSGKLKVFSCLPTFFLCNNNKWLPVTLYLYKEEIQLVLHKRGIHKIVLFICVIGMFRSRQGIVINIYTNLIIAFLIPTLEVGQNVPFMGDSTMSFDNTGSWLLK